MRDRLLVVLSKFHYAANAIAPPNKLPPELLRAVFSYLRPRARRDLDAKRTSSYEDLLAVSRVCCYWREIAVSATELWAHIILNRSVPVRGEVPIARLCVCRSGVRPLDFYYTPSPEPGPFSVEELIPDCHRLRSVVYWYAGEAAGDELASFLQLAPRLERLEINGDGISPLPTLFSGTAPYLWELALSRCAHWPNNQFGSLTSLYLLRQGDPDADIYSLLGAIRCSPHLEELLLEREFQPPTELQHPPERKISAIPLHSLKRLHICRLSTRATRRLLGALDLLPDGISMRFSSISLEFSAIFPETITPELSPHTATKLEVVYPHMGGAILHATNGVAHTRWTHRFFAGHHQFFHWMAERPHEAYHLKELWLHIDRGYCYEMPPPHALRGLETLVIETYPNEYFNSAFFAMLSPDEGGVPSPLLSTLELQHVFEVAVLGKVLKARSDVGFRLKTLRIRWFDGREARMAPLSQFVDKLESYHVTDKTSRGLELPRECTVRRGRWGPWSREFTGNDWEGLYD